MANKTLGVTTFCNWTSYGSMLQAYSLRSELSKIGIDSYILYDRRISLPSDKYRIRFNLNLKEIASKILNFRVRKQITAQYEKSISFIKRNIKIIYYNSYDEMKLNYFKADYYLTGSDQVFNPNNPQPGLFLDFVPDRKKRLTYACSMGSTRVSSEKQTNFSKLLNNFDVISVREEDNIEALKAFNEKASYFCHIDPVFLTDAESWRKLETPYPLNEKYILVYPLFWAKKYNKYLRSIHKMGYKIVGVFSSFNKDVYCNECLYDVGVQEFLWLIDHSEAVITSSFHGLALSLIFEKKISTVVNPSMPSRITHLINLLGVKSCNVVDVLNVEQDYKSINRRINEEKAKSINYLIGIFHEE